MTQWVPCLHGGTCWLGRGGGGGRGACCWRFVRGWRGRDGCLCPPLPPNPSGAGGAKGGEGAETHFPTAAQQTHFPTPAQQTPFPTPAHPLSHQDTSEKRPHQITFVDAMGRRRGGKTALHPILRMLRALGRPQGIVHIRSCTRYELLGYIYCCVLLACLFVTAVHCWAKWLCTAACHYKTSCDCTFIPMKHPICSTAGVVPMNTIFGT